MFQGGDGLDVLEVFRWTPQDPGRANCASGRPGVERQGAAAVVLGLLKPVILRIELKVDVHRDERQRRVGQRELRIVLVGLRDRWPAAARSVSCRSEELSRRPAMNAL